MDTISSSEFRKRFASLKEKVEVTVHGHVIGEWVPVDSLGYRTVAQLKADMITAYPGLGPREFAAEVDATGRITKVGRIGGFGAPRPAPKPGKGR